MNLSNTSCTGGKTSRGGGVQPGFVTHCKDCKKFEHWLHRNFFEKKTLYIHEKQKRIISIGLDLSKRASFQAGNLLTFQNGAAPKLISH